jgi:hypothetical protein
MNKKETILNMPMNMLGLGGAFNRWFFQRRMQQSDVITLKEFIALNDKLLATDESFITWRDSETHKILRYGFSRKYESWKKLKSFLILSGFSYKDWILLIPETEKSFDYSVLDKKILIKQPVWKICGVKPSCVPMECIASMFGDEDRPEKINIGQILELTLEVAQEKSIDYYINPTLNLIQNKLKAYGFNKKDGPFMNFFWKETKSEKDFVEELVCNKSFSKKDAVTAVKLAQKAGYINIQ